MTLSMIECDLQVNAKEPILVKASNGLIGPKSLRRHRHLVGGLGAER
jgi:hypothetical protein